MRNAPRLFALAIEAKMDFECMATQDAIDRIVSVAPFSSRQTMLECLRSNGISLLSELMLVAWVTNGPNARRKGLGLNANDLVLATGHDRDWWIALIDSKDADST